MPIITPELNEGEHFTVTRQLFLSMILSTWLKEVAKEEKSIGRMLGWYIGKNQPLQKDCFSIQAITELTEQGPGETCGTFGIDKDDPALLVPENVLFYHKYIQLFKRGLFRVARAENGDSPGEIVGRVYFSGAVEFSSLSVLLD